MVEVEARIDVDGGGENVLPYLAAYDLLEHNPRW